MLLWEFFSFWRGWNSFNIGSCGSIAGLIMFCLLSSSLSFCRIGAGVSEAVSNRDYVVRKKSDEIHEIIRVLQLTTYDEEEWDADDITVMKKAQVRHGCV